MTKVEEILEMEIRRETDNFQTIAGLTMSLFKRVPEVGEEIERNNLKFKIIDSDSRSVRLVEVVKINVD